MDDYYRAVLERHLGQDSSSESARRRVYDLARGAVERTFAAPERSTDLQNELGKLDSAIRDIEARFAQPSEAVAPVSSAPAQVAQVLPPPTNTRPVPQPPEQTAPAAPIPAPAPPAPRTSKPEAPPPKTAAPATPSSKAPAAPAAPAPKAPTPAIPAKQPAAPAPKKPSAPRTAVSKPPASNTPAPAAPRPLKATTEPRVAPDASGIAHHDGLFSSDTPPEPSMVADESSSAESRVIDRMKVVALLATLGIGAYLFSRNPLPPQLPSRSTAAINEAVPSTQLSETRWQLNGQEGRLVWSEGRDPPSLLLRDPRRPVLKAEGKLTPDGPSLTVVLLSADNSPFPRGDMIEFRFDGGAPGIAALASVRIALRDGSDLEPDGVVIRSGSGSFSLVFAQDEMARKISRTMLLAATRIRLFVTLQDNNSGTIDIELPDLIAKQFSTP